MCLLPLATVAVLVSCYDVTTLNTPLFILSQSRNQCVHITPLFHGGWKMEDVMTLCFLNPKYCAVVKINNTGEGRFCWRCCNTGHHLGTGHVTGRRSYDNDIVIIGTLWAALGSCYLIAISALCRQMVENQSVLSHILDIWRILMSPSCSRSWQPWLSSLELQTIHQFFQSRRRPLLGIDS